MNKPENIVRMLDNMGAYAEHVVADFTFVVDFRSVSTLSGKVQVSAPKTMTIQQIEQQANAAFVEMLQLAIEKSREGISN